MWLLRSAGMKGRVDLSVDSGQATRSLPAALCHSTILSQMSLADSAYQSSSRSSRSIMIIEGLLLLLGDGKPQHKEFKGIEKEVKSRILDVVMMPNDAPMY